MKFKKLLSLTAAAAISASCFAGMAMTASAADVTKTIEAATDTVYTADKLYGGTLSDITSWSLKDTFTSITPSESFGKTSDEFTSKYTQYVSGKKDVDATLNLNVNDGGYYLLEMLCQEYNTRYPKVTVNNSLVFTGATKNNDANDEATNAEHCINYSTIGGNTDDRKLGTFNSNNAAIVVLKFNLNEGANTINIASQNDSTSIQGLIAVNIKKMPVVPVTDLSLNISKAIIKPGSTVQLTKKIEPSDASEDVTWTSSDDNVLTVDSSGKVTAVAAGSATVTAAAANVSATVSFEVVGVSDAPAAPSGWTINKYKGNKETMTNGNLCTTEYTYRFVSDADATAKSLFADSEYGTTVDNELIANYLNYIGGTYGNHPTFTLSLPAGSYTLYYLGRGGDDNAKYMTVNNVQYNLDNGTNFAENGVKTLKLYKANIQLDEDLTNAEAVFDCAGTYLPDLYAVIIAGTKAKTADATGSTFINKSGEAAASFRTGEITINGTIANPKWIIKAKDIAKDKFGTATVDINDSNTTNCNFTDATVTFGIVLSNIDTTVYSDISAALVYTVE